MLCTVTGTLKDLTGQVLENTKVVFYRSGITGQDGDTVIPQYAEAISNGSGEITVNLYSGEYTAEAFSLNGVPEQFSVGVPDQASAVLSDLIDQTPALTPSMVSDAVDARDGALAAEAGAVAAAGTAAASAAAGVQTTLEGIRDQAEAHETGAQTAQTAAETAAANLASVAYQQLTAIAESLALTGKTAMFVYDTSKDSDGGAWRKKCKHLSWYNEALSTADRGATREFPAIVGIVGFNGSGASGGVNIYDLTDPACPLWMRFHSGYSWGTGPMLVVAGRTGYAEIKAVSMKNGKLMVGSMDGGSAHGVHEIDFLHDRCFLRTSFGGRTGFTNHPSIAQRNEGLGHDEANQNAPANKLINSGGVAALDFHIQDDAPVDEHTGLQIPDWHIACDTGLSIIRNDGTTVNGTTENSSWHMRDVMVDDHGNAWTYSKADAGYGGLQFLSAPPYVTVDAFGGGGDEGFSKIRNVSHIHGIDPNYPRLNSMRPEAGVAIPRGFAIGGSPENNRKGGITLVRDNPADRANSAMCHITNEANTGWLVGDCILSVLNDTDSTDLVGADLFSATGQSGTITNATSPWYSVENLGQASISGEVITWNASSWESIRCDFGMLADKHYLLEFEVSVTSGQISIYEDAARSVEALYQSGTHFVALSPESTGNAGIAQISTQSFVGTVELKHIWVATPNQSPEPMSLEVNGAVAVNPVATGAEAVGYSGKFKQPFNDAFEIGTGDFGILAWVKIADTASKQTIFARSASGGNGGLEFYIDSVEKLQLRVTANDWGSAPRLESSDELIVGNWALVYGGRLGGVLESSINAVSQGTLSGSQDIDNALAQVRIGYDESGGAAFLGDYRDIRFFKQALSADDVRAIFEAERHKFIENAACTIDGSVDVQALAYDDKSDELIVGTDKVSKFKGLVRTESNTDDPVLLAAGSGVLMTATSATVEIDKPAINLREELAALSAGSPVTKRTDVTDDWAFDGVKTVFDMPIGQKPRFVDLNGTKQRAGGSQVAFQFTGHRWQVSFTTAPIISDWAEVEWEYVA